MTQTLIDVRLTVNGEPVERAVEPRRSLVDFLRHDLGLTGTHVGCEQGVCGMCTVLLDGEPIKSCLMLAVQADGAEITTIEALNGEELHPAPARVQGGPRPAVRLLHAGLHPHLGGAARARARHPDARSSRRSSPASCAGAPATRTS